MSLGEDGRQIGQHGRFVDTQGLEIPSRLVKILFDRAQAVDANHPDAEEFERLRGSTLLERSFERVGQELILHLDSHVLVEDDDLLIVNKPPFLFSQGNNPHDFGVEEIVRELRGNDIYLAHRLDRGTSGVLILAKGFDNLVQMGHQFANKSASGMRKYYATLLDGELAGPESTQMQVNIRPVGGDSRLMEVVPEEEKETSGLDTATIFKPLALLATQTNPPSYKTAALVQLITGRTHQIRVVTAQGFGKPMPVSGDIAYGSQSIGIGRPMLHALRVDFNHPRSGKAQSVVAPMPLDMKRIFNSLTMVKDYRTST